MTTPRVGKPVEIQALWLNSASTHWQTTLITADPEVLFGLLRTRLFSLVSPRIVSIDAGAGGIRRAVVLRDPDGHAMRLAAR